MGNGEAKELICTTHGHELKGRMRVRGGVQGGGEYKRENATVVVA